MLARVRAAGLLGPFVMTALGLACLVALGSWQMSRKIWKEDLITMLEERSQAAAVPLADAVKRFEAGEDVEYLRVSVKGRFQHDKERYFYAPDVELGPGVNVYTPLDTPTSGVVFINRGYIKDAAKDPTKRVGGQLSGDVEITGLIRKPGDRQSFVPENDVAKNLWHWRDLSGLMASAFGTTVPKHVPFFVDAEASATPPGGWPRGGATLAKLSNRHLEYALTWYGLAAALLVIFALFARGRLTVERP